jgi:hypothetical protein
MKEGEVAEVIAGHQAAKDWVSIPGATANVYAVTNLQVQQGGTYAVAVRDEDDVTASDEVGVIVDVPVLLFSDNFAAVDSKGNYTNTISPNSLKGGSGRGSNTNATREVGEPFHADKHGKNSVWVTWTPQQSGVRPSTRKAAASTPCSRFTRVTR